MVGSELNPTQGKRGGKPGDIGASSFRGFREYFREVFRSRFSFFAPKLHENTCLGG